MEVFFFEFGKLVRLLCILGKFGFSEPLLPLLGSFNDIVNDTVVIAIDFLFEKLGDPAISVLISPQLA